jgi:hypothetical protein
MLGLRPARGREWRGVRSESLASLPAGQAEALIIGQASEHAWGGADQRHPYLRINVVGTEPPITVAAANHRVLVARDRAATSFALRRKQ